MKSFTTVLKNVLPKGTSYMSGMLRAIMLFHIKKASDSLENSSSLKLPFSKKTILGNMCYLNYQENAAS